MLKRMILKSISITVLATFFFESACYGLATAPASQNPAVKREIQAALARTQVRYAESEDALRLLSENGDAPCLLLSCGKYLIKKEAADNDIRLLSAIYHEDVEALMQIIAKEDRYKYQAIKELILKYFPPENTNKLPTELYINHTVAAAFQWLLLLHNKLLSDGDIPRSEAPFLVSISKVINAHKSGCFTAEFWDSRERGERIRRALNDGMMFYQVMSAPPDFLCDAAGIEERLVSSGRFSRYQAKRYARVLMEGVDNLTGLKMPERDRLSRLLYIAGRSYELSARYLSGLIKEAGTGQAVWPVSLLETLKLGSEEDISRAEYLFSLVKEDSIDGPRNVRQLEEMADVFSSGKERSYKWLAIEDLGRLEAIDRQQRFIIADNETASHLKSIIGQGVILEDYLGSQPVFRLNDSAFNPEDIRSFHLPGNNFKKYVSKKRSASYPEKFAGAVDEFEKTVMARTRIEQEALTVDGISKPVRVNVVRPRALINLQDQSFILTDFVDGQTMEGFLRSKSIGEREPYIRLLKALFQRLFDKGIVWGSPYLRNIIVSADAGNKIGLTLIDWEKTVFANSPSEIPNGLKEECMTEVWRKAAILTREERDAVTAGYFAGPEGLSPASQEIAQRAIRGIELNFGRMMMMEPALQRGQIADGMNNRILKERIAVFEERKSDIDGEEVTLLSVETMLRDWYTINGEDKEIFYDLFYSAKQQGLLERLVPVIWRVFQEDWLFTEVSRRGLVPQPDRGGQGDKRDVLIELIKLSWEMDMMNRLEGFLSWVEENPGRLMSRQAIRNFDRERVREEFAAQNKYPPFVSETKKVTSEGVEEVIRAVSKKIKRYRPDIAGERTDKFHATFDDKSGRINIICNETDKTPREYVRILNEQIKKFLSISGLKLDAGGLTIISWREMMPQDAGVTGKPVVIDGEAGGGQVVRNALTLSAVLKKPFFMHNVRARRDMPGLRTTHVGAIELAKALTRAFTSDYERSSTEFYFAPDEITAGNYEIDMERISSGSPSLVSSIVQTVLPIALFADKPSTFRMRGGTNLADGLSATYIKDVLLPFLHQHFGIDAEIEIIKYGWQGQGEILLTVNPLEEELKAAPLLKRGAFKKMALTINASRLSEDETVKLEKLSRRWKSAAEKYHVPVTVKIEDVTARSSEHRAIEIFIKIECENIAVGFTSTADMGNAADKEVLMDNAWEDALSLSDAYLRTDAFADKHMADMIIPYAAFARGASIYSTSEVTDHLQRGAAAFNSFMDKEGSVDIEGELGAPGRVIVKGIAAEPPLKRCLADYAASYGFFRNTRLLRRWIGAWAELLGTDRQHVIAEMRSNEARHAFPRAMVLPEEMPIYLLPLLKQAGESGMRPVFLKRAAGMYKNAYNFLAETVQEFYQRDLLPAMSLKVSRLENSGLDRGIFFNNFRDPPAAAQTTIFSPTINSLLSEKEKGEVLSTGEIQEMAELYRNMDAGDKKDLDRYLKDIWGLGKGFAALLEKCPAKSEWVRYLADWGVDSRYYMYLYNQKTKIPWDADFSGAGHKKLIDIVDRVFERGDTVSVPHFLNNFRQVLIDIGCEELTPLLDDKEADIPGHLRGMADNRGILHKHQSKTFLKMLRVLIAAHARFRLMRDDLRHRARPLLNVILRQTSFKERTERGMIFVDEVTNGGENILYSEIICKAFNPRFRYRFMDVSQIHPELSELYTKLGIVDGVLAPQGLHPLEDFPEIMDSSYELDASVPTLRFYDHETALAGLKADLEKQDRARMEENEKRRKRSIDELLSDPALAALLEEMKKVSSYRALPNFYLGDELVKNYLRLKRDTANFVDSLTFPNAFFTGVTGLSNREYPLLDREWDLIARFRARLGDMAAGKARLMTEIYEADEKVKISDYVKFLELWCAWYHDKTAEITLARSTILANSGMIREFLSGKIADEIIVSDLVGRMEIADGRDEIRQAKAANGYIKEYSALLNNAKLADNTHVLTRLATALIDVRRKHGRIFVVGNGEDAAMASHMIVDMAKSASAEGTGKRLQVISLNNPSWIAAVANDIAFEAIYEEQLKNYRITEDDIVIAVEGGEMLSRNIAIALGHAAAARAKTALLARQNIAKAYDDPSAICVPVPTNIRSQAENIFLTVNHALVEILKEISDVDAESPSTGRRIGETARRYYHNLGMVIEKTELENITAFVGILRHALHGKKNIYLLGNGGHVATASHIAYKLKDMVRQAGMESGVIAALTEDLSDITGISQGGSYDDVFVEQLKPVLRAGDVVIGISTSGNSENIVRALEFAIGRGADTIGICGFSGGRIKALSLRLFVPNLEDGDKYGRTEDIFLFGLNMTAELLKVALHRDRALALEREVDDLFRASIDEILHRRGVGTNPGCWISTSQGRFYLKGAWEEAGKLGENQLRIEYVASQIYGLLGYPFPQTRLMRVDGHLVLLSKELPGIPIGNEDMAFCQNSPEIMRGFLIDCYLGSRNSAYPKNIIRTTEGRIARVDAGGALLSSSRGHIKPFRPDVELELSAFRDPTVNPHGAELFKHVTDQVMREAIFGTGRYIGLAELSDADIETIVKSAGFEEGIDWPLAEAGKIKTLIADKRDADKGSLTEAEDVLREVIDTGGFEPYLARRLKERRDWLIEKYSRLAAAAGKPRAEPAPSSKEGKTAVADESVAYFAARGTWTKDLSKERLYGELLRKLLPESAIVLDVGCGVGHLTIELKRRGFNSVGLDVSHGIMKEAARLSEEAAIGAIPYVQGSAFALPFRDNSLDAITLTNVLEHLSAEEGVKFAKEARRVLKKGGHLLIGVPAKTPMSMLKYYLRKLYDPHMWRYKDIVVDDTGDLTHKVWYTDKKLFGLLRENGFSIQKADYFVYRTAEWPRGKLFHWLQRILDKYDTVCRLKRQLAFGMYALGKKIDDEPDEVRRDSTALQGSDEEPVEDYGLRKGDISSGATSIVTKPETTARFSKDEAALSAKRVLDEEVEAEGFDGFGSMRARVLIIDLLYAELHEDRIYEIRYDKSRLSPAQADIVETYINLLKARSARPGNIRPRPFSGKNGAKESLIAVYCAGKGFKGEGHIDVEIPGGRLEDYILRITGMMNIVLASSNIPSDLSGDNMDDHVLRLLSYIKRQYDAISSKPLVIPASAEDIPNALRELKLSLPASSRRKAEEIDEHNRLAKIALRNA